MRNLLRSLIEGETSTAQWFFTVIAGLLTALLFASIGGIPLSASNEAIYIQAEKQPLALQRSTVEQIPGMDPSQILGEKLNNARNAISAGSSHPDQLSDGSTASKALEMWVADYLCPVKGWGSKTEAVRLLVWNDFGHCPWPQRLTARVPALFYLGLGWGLVFLTLFTLLTVGALLLTLNLHNARKAYRWLYKSRVF